MIINASKDEIEQSATNIRRKFCGYDMGMGKEPSKCDCKYGAHELEKMTGETSGCCEMRTLGCHYEEIIGWMSF